MPLALPIMGFGLTNAVGNLTFQNPVAVASPPGETNRLFVAERGGRILVITNLAQPSVNTFLDLSAKTDAAYVESGLLGFAFHPRYSSNGFVYVCRTLTKTNGFFNQVSRFQASATDPNRGLPSTEVVLLSQPDETALHNAGDVHFGPDGYLYVSLGYDGPVKPERSLTRQPIDGSLFGAILRIDVDKRPGSLAPNPHPAVTTNYAIPPDNPFVGITSYQGMAVDPLRVRTEFYAVGFRNPWRMAFDTATGRLYCGDVGGALIEELNLITKGANYGWPYREGPYTNELERLPQPQQFSLPLHHYFHGRNSTNQGEAIIGGVVYRGLAIPQLYGSYIFGDSISGHIWSLRHFDTNVTSLVRVAGEAGIGSFGIDPRNREVLVVNHYEGIIKRLVYVPPEQVATFPQTLADTGAFSDLRSLTPSPGVAPYEINVPFWSDHAIKTRWFSVPDPSRSMRFHSESNWFFPAGTVWVKHFDLEITNGVPSSRRRLETRVLVKSDPEIYGVTYRWGTNTSNAFLVPDEGADEKFVVYGGGTVRTQLWRYPSRNDCVSCHTAGAGYALGFNTAQMNCTVDYAGATANQLQALAQAGYFETGVPNPRTLQSLAPATNTGSSLEHRARSYLAANCVQCHHPAGPAGTKWETRISVRRDDAAIINARVVGEHPEMRIVSPGSRANSLLWQRMSYPDVERMPPLGSRVLDTNGINLILEWIDSIPSSPWRYEDIGAALFEGSSTLRSNVCVVSGSGIGIEEDSLHLLHRPLNGNGEVVGRVVGWLGSNAPAQVGIMIRDAIEEQAAYAAVLLTQSGIAFYARTADGSPSLVSSITAATAPCWLRLVREGDLVTGYYSNSSSEWTRIGSQRIGMLESAAAGFTVASGEPTEYRGARFESIGVGSIVLAAPSESHTYPVSADIRLSAVVEFTGMPVRKVEFYADSRLLGAVMTPPYRFTWTNALAGTHSLKAVMLDAYGCAVTSAPVSLTVKLQETSCFLERADSRTAGNWKTAYGRDGHIIAGGTTNLPHYADLAMDTIRTVVWAKNALNESALRKANQAGRIAAAWQGQKSFTIDVTIRDGKAHQLGLYFLDWNTDNRRVQTVELFDASTGVLLDHQTLRKFTTGKFRVWTVRGHVRITVTTENKYAPVLSGIFFDKIPNALPKVSLVSPTDNSALLLPEPVRLETQAIDSDGQVQSVEFFANGDKVGQASSAPYVCVWSNALAGTYALSARATDNYGNTDNSMPVYVNLALPPAHAAFIGVDETTRGTWRQRYGFNGFVIASHATNPPASAPITVTNALTYTWSEHTEDASALMRLDTDDRIAATWHGNDFLVDVPLLDGARRRLALYFLGDVHTRLLEVRLSDAVTGRLLDVQEVTSFAGGKYLIWTVQGRVQVRVRRLSGLNAVLSALFVDPETNRAPIVRLTKPASLAGSTPARAVLQAEASADVGICKIEFFADDNKIGEATSSPYSLAWGILAGNYPLRARAIDNLGVAKMSTPVWASVTLPSSEAAFVGVDTSTLGLWPGFCGIEGFYISQDVESPAPYAQLAVRNFFPWVWDPRPVDPRALLRAEAPAAIAAAWVGNPVLGIDLTLADGLPHRVALYCLDYDLLQRAQRISITDLVTGRVLDTREIRNFASGQYWIWNIRGRVRIAMSPLSVNAVVSAIFLDAANNPVDFPSQSGSSEPSEVAWSKDGLEPQNAKFAPAPRVEIRNDHLYLTLSKASNETVVFEYSTDLLTWTRDPAFLQISKSSTDGQTETFAVYSTSSVNRNPRGFVRWHVLRD